MGISISTSSDSDDDLDAIAVFNVGVGMATARHDRTVALDRHALAGETARREQHGDGRRGVAPDRLAIDHERNGSHVQD
jgi:hypothetical protein